MGSLGTAEGATYSVWDVGHLSWTVKAESRFCKTGENSREALFNVTSLPRREGDGNAEEDGDTEGALTGGRRDRAYPLGGGRGVYVVSS